MKRTLAVIALIVAADSLRAQCPDGTPPPCSAVAPGPNSVGVMQFNNVTRDSNIAYLSDGLATDIATSLARVPRLEVRSPGAVRAAQRGVEASPSVVGRRLNVRYVVEGDFQRGGDRVRVSVRLVAVPSGTQRWSNSYTRPVTDLLAVQEEIAGAVATAIAGELLPQDRTRLAVQPTRSGEAYDHYLRGNYYLARRDSIGYARALSEYQAALAADPAFADALARQATTYVISGGALGLPRDTLLVRASAAAEEAVRRAPNSAIAWLALAQSRHFREPRTLAGGSEAMSRALALDSNNAEVLHAAAVTASYNGDFPLAFERNHRALAVEPLRPVTLNNLLTLSLISGRYVEAVRWADSLEAIDADYYAPRWRPPLLVALMMTGDSARARAELAHWRGIPSMQRLIEPLGQVAIGPDGDSARFDQVVAEELARQQRGGDPSTSFGINATFATLLLIRGASSGTVMSVLEAMPARDAQLRTYLRSRHYDRLRNDPRFQRLWAETAP